MGDLQYLDDNFTGVYVSQMPEYIVLDHVRQDPAFSVEIERRALIARGLMRFYFTIMPNSDVLLVDNNDKEVRFPINTLQDGFWFTNVVCQSIARYENNTLTIEMIRQSPTERKVIYQFHELPRRRKNVEVQMFKDCGKSWTITYDKVD